MIRRRISVDGLEFPEEIRAILQHAAVYDSSCSSDAMVYYLDTGFYIKVDAKGMLAAEAELGRRFHAMGLGVEVVCYVSADRDYLVTRSAEGEDLTHCIGEPEQLVRVLAKSLRMLHDRPLDGFPISSRLQRYRESAAGVFDGGFYDPFVLTERYPVSSKEEAWERMQSCGHLLKADTLIHGDACLPNLIQKNGAFSAFIDFSMAGIGDRHIDLYWAIWSLQFNLKTEAYTDLFLDLYGRDACDEERLRVIAAFELFG